MLKTFGAQNVYLLDGGLRAWVEAGSAHAFWETFTAHRPAFTPNSITTR